MIYEDAIYDVLDRAIEAQSGDLSHPLNDCNLYATLRGSVRIEAKKIIRVSVLSGQFAFRNETANKFENVEAIIQCYVRADSKSDADIDEAEEASFEIANEVCKVLSANPTLKNADNVNQVCISLFRDFTKGTVNVWGTMHGATYLSGMINQTNF
jgi:hypothetical protein